MNTHIRHYPGETVGLFTLVRPDGKAWFARCQCGRESRKFVFNIAVAKSCGAGCLLLRPRDRSERTARLRTVPEHRRVERHINQRFGRLVVNEIVERKAGGHVRVSCSCDCGATHEALLNNIVKGLTRSCGCLKRETAGDRLRTHGMSDSPEYHIWFGMRQRCGDPANPGYSSYGARGIKVCERWQSFGNFIADMGPRPSLDHSIDRINNDGGYEPGNCRWATAREQARNTRRTVFIEHEGQRVPAVSVYEQHGVSRQLFESRVKHGWNPVVAATQPPRKCAAKAQREAA